MFPERGRGEVPRKAHNLQTPVQFRAPQHVILKPPLGGFNITCCGAESKWFCFRPELNKRNDVSAIQNAETSELSQRTLMNVV